MIGRILSLSLYGWGFAIGTMTLIPMVIGFPIVRLQAVQCSQDATEPTPESTREWIDFQKPIGAQQCIGPEGSKLIPENPKIDMNFLRLQKRLKHSLPDLPYDYPAVLSQN